MEKSFIKYCVNFPKRSNKKTDLNLKHIETTVRYNENQYFYKFNH